MPAKGYLAIPGSRREAMPGATRTGPCDPSERIRVTVVLRKRPPRKRAKTIAQIAASGERLTRAEYKARYGAADRWSYCIVQSGAFWFGWVSKSGALQKVSGNPRNLQRRYTGEQWRI